MSRLVLTPDEPASPAKAKKKPQANGYACPPGTGPEGETCRTCAHSTARPGGGKTFWKCALVKPTHGLGTDIRLKSPACRMWVAAKEGRA